MFKSQLLNLDKGGGLFNSYVCQSHGIDAIDQRGR